MAWMDGWEGGFPACTHADVRSLMQPTCIHTASNDKTLVTRQKMNSSGAVSGSRTYHKSLRGIVKSSYCRVTCRRWQRYFQNHVPSSPIHVIQHRQRIDAPCNLFQTTQASF